MPWERVVSNALSKWMEATGPASDIVLSSRVRLARNIEGLPFPHLMSEEQVEQVIKLVEAAVRELNLMGVAPKVELYRLGTAAPLDREVLVEKHLISPHHARESRAAVAISDDEAISIMVNEEDHLRIQCLFPGLQLDEAWKLASRVDDALEQKITYAFSEKRGYLTACPTNIGTGIRASVMMHLPGLVLTNQAGRVIAAMSQVGLVVRGLYGEGTEAIGNIFQVSNQITLGHTEEEIIDNLKAVARQIIDQENAAREMLRKEMKEQLEDRIGRAYGLLSSARIMTSEEAMRLISDVRLGIDLGIITNVKPRVLNEFLVLTRPGFLQKLAGKELSPFDRDVRRASLIRERLKSA